MRVGHLRNPLDAPYREQGSGALDTGVQSGFSPQTLRLLSHDQRREKQVKEGLKGQEGLSPSSFLRRATSAEEMRRRTG